MNQKIPFQDLAARLAAAAGVTDDDSRKFIKDFFDVVEEGLLADGEVKIKDFGTFTLSADASGNREVKFVADPLIADTINAPFSQFEPETLSDEVTDTMLDEVKVTIEEEEKSEHEPTETVVAETPEVSVTPAPVEPQPEPEPEAEPEPVSESIEEEEEEPVYIPPVSPSTNSSETPDNPGIPNNTPEVITIEEDEEEVAETPSPVKPVKIEYAADDEQEAPAESKGGFGLGFFLGLIVGLAVGAAATFFLTNTIADRYGLHDDETEIEELIEEPTVEVSEPQTAPDDSIATPQPQAEAPTAAAEPAPAPAPAPEVTETVRPGFLMMQMAAKHYGNKIFWVYIYQENKSKIKNPDNLPAGLVLVIPSASKYGINSSDKSSVDKARALESKILSSK